MKKKVQSCKLFERLEIPLIGLDGNSQWPERFSNELISILRQKDGPNKFNSQMLLQPVNVAEGRLAPDRLTKYEGSLEYQEANQTGRLSLEGTQLISASCWWDPAYGTTKTGDASVIACLFTSTDGTYWLHDIEYLKETADLSPDTDVATQMCREIVAFVRKNFIPSVTIETNGLGKFLPGLLRREFRASGTRCAIIEHVSTRNKDLRILEAFDAVLAAQRLRVHAKVYSSPFVREMREWRPGTNCRDDGLDAVAGCLLSEPVRLPLRGAAELQDSPLPWTLGGRSVTADHGFEP